MKTDLKGRWFQVAEGIQKNTTAKLNAVLLGNFVTVLPHNTLILSLPRTKEIRKQNKRSYKTRIHTCF